MLRYQNIPRRAPASYSKSIYILTLAIPRLTTRAKATEQNTSNITKLTGLSPHHRRVFAPGLRRSPRHCVNPKKHSAKDTWQLERCQYTDTPNDPPGNPQTPKLYLPAPTSRHLPLGKSFILYQPLSASTLPYPTPTTISGQNLNQQLGLGCAARRSTDKDLAVMTATTSVTGAPATVSTCSTIGVPRMRLGTV